MSHSKKQSSEMSGLSKTVPPQLPEILDRVGFFLNPSEILAAIKVCRLWYHAFKPHLASNINDEVISEIYISNGRLDRAVVDSVQKLFGEHGRYARHLQLHQRPLLDVVTMEPSVKNLETLAIRNIRSSSLISVDEYPWVEAMPISERQNLIDKRRREMINGPYIWPERSANVYYPGAFTDQGPRRAKMSKQDLDWQSTQQFWLFLRANKGLRELRLDWSLTELLIPTSTEFLYTILSGFKEMTVFDNEFMPVCLDKVLSLMPKLKCFRRYSTLINGGILINTHVQLRILELGNVITTRAFYSLLGNLPNLDQLRTREFRSLEVELSQDEIQTLTNNMPSRLTQWRCDGISLITKSIIAKALQWVPAITHVAFGGLDEDITFSLAIYCKKLEYIRQFVDEIYNTPRYQIIETKPLQYLLKHCPNLKTIDMSKQFINHTSIVAHARNSLSGTADSDTNRENDGDDNDNEELDSWACYDQLTTLCCQIGLVDRLNNDDQALYDKISVPGYTARLPRKRHLAVTLHYERLVSQEIKIYTALARLTALRVLDIGYRAIQLSPFKFQHIKGTLQLKLESGLGLLGALAQLEEFGFEGVDHRMEEAEIEWMAQAWPRLKVMYGLEADNPEWSQYEERRNSLRVIMERLRPDVRHVPIKIRSREGP